jgi:hypothetical protein
VLPSQVKRIPRAFEVEVLVNLKAKEEIQVGIRATRKETNAYVRMHSMRGADRILDIVKDGEPQQNTSVFETDFYRIEFSWESGIKSLINRKTGEELLRSDLLCAPFSGVYEVTEHRQSAVEERRRMGRNRKMPHTKRFFSTLDKIEIVEEGDVHTVICMDYKLEGTHFYQVFLKVYRALARIDINVRIHKIGVWEPENLYIALPFTGGKGETKYIDKTGCILRPGIDQLPGSNKEFYLIQNGVFFKGEKCDIILSVKDTPLLTFGSLESKPIVLCSGEDESFNRETTYSWAMNNYWETNFKVDLGGFYEFSYSLATRENMSPKNAMELCEAMNEGLVAYNIATKTNHKEGC